jgi:hypothetical protein
MATVKPHLFRLFKTAVYRKTVQLKSDFIFLCSMDIELEQETTIAEEIKILIRKLWN